MARLVKQFRFYGADNAKNYPEVCTYQALAAGNIFKNYSPVTQLGIQADPGFKFYLNIINRVNSYFIYYYLKLIIKFFIIIH